MALFGTPNAFIGLDLGTSSIKVVELIDRNKRVEVAAYASAECANQLIDPGADDTVVQETATVLGQLLEHGHVTADTAIVALPTSRVFSTVLKLPNVDDDQLATAVHAAAREVVPADLQELTLSWSRLAAAPKKRAFSGAAPSLPVFVTAAPKQLVERYRAVVKATGLELLALEVETAPLARALLGGSPEPALIVDIGDTITTFHVIDHGTPRLTHSSDQAGQTISRDIAGALSISVAEAEQLKQHHGLAAGAPAGLPEATAAAVRHLTDEASRISAQYTGQEGREISKTVLIGGSALLKGLAGFWTREVGHAAILGNPWKGLAYPEELEERVPELASTYAVAIGLAQRGIDEQRGRAG